MYTHRHNFDLVLRNSLKAVIAPRMFALENGKVRFVHILDGYCQYVQVFDYLCCSTKPYVQVAVAERLKLYANTKGLYFNYSYWVNDYTKKTIRVYLCD